MAQKKKGNRGGQSAGMTASQIATRMLAAGRLAGDAVRDVGAAAEDEAPPPEEDKQAQLDAVRAKNLEQRKRRLERLKKQKRNLVAKHQEYEANALEHQANTPENQRLARQETRRGERLDEINRKITNTRQNVQAARTAEKQVREEQKQEQTSAREAARATIDAVVGQYQPGIDDLALMAFNMRLSDAVLMARDQNTRFYDPKRRSIKKDGTQYTIEDAMQRDAAGNPIFDENGTPLLKEGWALDMTTLKGPLFREKGRGTHTVIPDYPDSLPYTEDPYAITFEEQNPNRDATMLEWIREVTKWSQSDKERLADLQARLYQAGYYENIGEDARYALPTDPESDKVVQQPAYGFLDTDTINAIALFTQDAVSQTWAMNMDIYEYLDYQTAARKKRFGVDDLLGYAAGAGRGGGGGGGGGGGSAKTIAVTSDAAIRQAGDEVGQEVYGRRLTADESQAVFDLVREAEIAEANQAEVGGVVEAVDVDSLIRRYLRQRDANTSTAHDTAGAFAMFAQLLGEGMGFGGGGFGSSTVGPAGSAGILAGPGGGA